MFFLFLFIPLYSTPSTTGLQGVDFSSMTNSLSVFQAAASLAPAIAQLLQQQQEQQQQEQQQQQQQQMRQIQFQQSQPAAVDPIRELTARLQESRETEALRQALQAALSGKSSHQEESPAQSLTEAINKASLAQNLQIALAQHQQPNTRSVAPNPVPQQIPVKNDNTFVSLPKAAPPSNTSTKRQRSEQDNQDGNVLLGFLSSLRQSYEEAVKEKEAGDIKATATRPLLPGATTPRPPQQRLPTVSDFSSAISSTTTNQPDSSLEDWNSDKKTETSSSEDSEKETGQASPRVPPRKRHKTTKPRGSTIQPDSSGKVGALTASNLAAHSRKESSD
jgi:hypothetical protein